jgi:hypothetical protein
MLGLFQKANQDVQTATYDSTKPHRWVNTNRDRIFLLFQVLKVIYGTFCRKTMATNAADLWDQFRVEQHSFSTEMGALLEVGNCLQ